MSSPLRRTPAMIDVLRCLLSMEDPIWGLQVSVQSGRQTGTVYPLLDRLEQAGVVSSMWELENDRPGPRRRMYSLTPAGRGWAQEQSKAAELAEVQTARSRPARATQVRPA